MLQKTDTTMLWLIILLCSTIVAAHKFSENYNCGYSSCHPTKDGYINVHIVPHTHDDVGWVRTFDQYYRDYVTEILNSVFQALRRNQNRRFIYVESAFLFKWWKEQTELTKTLFKKLINNGQLEFVSGGWSMNDEATTNYQSIIDQLTLGLSQINDTFGFCGRPRVGWQIDPFGHSREMASIFSQLGFDGLFLGRIHYQDKIQRFKKKTAEMKWQGSESLGNDSYIFTSVLFNHYTSPEEFNFESNSENFSEKQFEEKWELLVRSMAEQAKVYQTKNIMLTMGHDFAFKDAERWFSTLDRLIKYGNDQQGNGSKYHLLYSTPSCYLKAVHDEAKNRKLLWPTKIDDFFPYAHKKFSYWTGFYTSRPALKRFERLGNNFLQVCKQLYVLADLNESYRNNLNSLREAMGVLQHHDAVSGTEKQEVADDYAQSLSRGFKNCGLVVSKALNNLRTVPPIANDTVLDNPINSCLLSNISQCEFTENAHSFVVTIYNPLSRSVNHYVRIPVTQGGFVVRGPRDERPLTQLLPIPEQVLNIPGRKGRATLELVFRVAQIPPLGFKSYYVIKNKPQPPIPIELPYYVRKNETCFRYGPTEKGSYKRKATIKISKESGFLTKITMNKRTVSMHQKFLFYEGACMHSGAYLFGQKGVSTVAQNVTFTVYRGELVTEVHQTFNEWSSQIIRTYRDENFVEFQWLIGPLPQDDIGREVISRFTTALNTESTFYTDSNGREILRRIKDVRPTWTFESTVPVSENYYPVTSKIVVRDANKDIEFAILTDRSQGGSSLADGQIELMIHRNTKCDDDLGVAEILNEKAFGEPLVVRGSHYVLLGPYINQSADTTAAQEKDLTQRKLLEAWTFLSSAHGFSYDLYKTLYKLEYSGLKYALPKNVQILTLEPWSINRFLLRVEHVFAKSEDPELSNPAVVDLEHLFYAFKIINLRETTLGGNQWLNENNRMKFSFDEFTGTTDKFDHTAKETNDKFKITLNPIQIRTFVVEYAKEM